MLEKTVKARKNHKCDWCGKTISKGDVCNFMAAREPRFADDHETQIGIKYMQIWFCTDNQLCQGFI